MSAYELMAAHPWMTFWLAVLIVLVTENAVCGIVNRILRHRNIHKHGYPPPHCDADGDFKERG